MESPRAGDLLQAIERVSTENWGFCWGTHLPCLLSSCYSDLPFRLRNGIKIMDSGALRLGLQLTKGRSFQNLTFVRFHMSLCMNQKISSNTHTLSVQWDHALSKFSFTYWKYLVSIRPYLTGSPVLCLTPQLTPCCCSGFQDGMPRKNPTIQNTKWVTLSQMLTSNNCKSETHMITLPQHISWFWFSTELWQIQRQHIRQIHRVKSPP